MAKKIPIFGELESRTDTGIVVDYSAVGNAPKPDKKTISLDENGMLVVNYSTVVPKDLSEIEQVNPSEIETTEQKQSGMLYIDFGGNPKKISLEQISVKIEYDEDECHLQIK